MAAEPLAIKVDADRGPQTLQLERLLDEVIDPLLEGIDREVHRAMAGEEDDRDVGIDGAQLGDQGQAIAIGQALIENREIGVAVLHQGEGRFAAVGLEHGQIREGAGDRIADGGFIVNNQQRFHCASLGVRVSGFKSRPARELAAQQVAKARTGRTATATGGVRPVIGEPGTSDLLSRGSSPASL